MGPSSPAAEYGTEGDRWVHFFADEARLGVLDEPPPLPVLAADLTFVKVNGGRTFAHISNWDEDAPPQVGQQVVAADGSSRRLPATITALRADGTIELSMIGDCPG
jgi:hypothetical protein